MNWSTLVGLCLSVCAGLALDCVWDQDINPEQGLTYVDARMVHRDKIKEVSDPDACRAACCSVPDCDLALVTYLTPGKPLCMLVDCMNQDRDVCHLEPSTQSRVYRKNGTREAGRTAEESGDALRVVPMMVSWKTETSNSKTETIKSQEAESTVKPEPAVKESTPAQKKEMSAADFAEKCEAEPQVGPCRAAFQHWYYKTETRSCQSFIYGGCRGNKNNYVSKESCMATCTVTVLPSSKKVAAAADVSKEYKDDCMATSDPGPCRAAFPMFYYDPNTAACQSFIYGGCHGNKNRYSTMDGCMSRCRQDGSFATHGKASDHWTAGVFLFVTLAVISALLLAALVVIAVRRHNLYRHLSSISDKEELLPDLDEQSSVESVTVPESPKPDKA